MVERSNLLLATATTPDVTDLKDGAQVGLSVVAELAKREGVQVSLRRSAYGGLLVIVLLPGRLLTSGAEGRDPDGTPVSPAVAGPAAAPPRHNRLDTVEVPTVAAVAVPESAKAESQPPPQPAPLPRRQREGSKPALPHRRPQQHLAPGLRDDDPEAAAAARMRSPEEAQARFARYQQGRTLGRAATSDGTVTDAAQGRNP
jgi:hypothetical protein